MIIELSHEEYVPVGVRFKGGRQIKWWLSWLCTHLQSARVGIIVLNLRYRPGDIGHVGKR